MSKCEDDRISNPSINPSFETVLEGYLSRRQVLQGGLAAMSLSFLGLPLSGCGSDDDDDAPAGPMLGFQSITTSTEDTVRVPQGYSFQVFAPWGTPIGHSSQPAGQPAFKTDASNTGAEQAFQVGMHHDGMHFFSLPLGSASSDRGLLVMNHEYVDDGLLHFGGIDVPSANFVSPTGWTADKVLKAQNAHGVTIIEIRREGNRWSIVAPSQFARRLTANTPMRITGPAAGSNLMKTAADPAGTTVLGTANNCAHGYTPWNTYLTCEENWNGYFTNSTGDVEGVPAGDQKIEILRGQSRYGVVRGGFGYRWHEFDERFDAAKHPNEPNRFGWVVEIDPFDPNATPVKHTAMGRIKHENAAYATAANNRLAFYMGDDERNEYIYKFVTRNPYNPNDRAANRTLLDEGVLYVAKFNADGTGQWLALVHGQNGLTAANGFADQAEVLVKTRQAADRAGATMMDRPEWIAVHPTTKEVYCTLTNNSRRGSTPPSSNNPDGSTSAAAARPPVDTANPRSINNHGHIVRWRENNGDPTGTGFTWDIFVLAGDPASTVQSNKGNIKGDIFSAPDGLWIDPAGRLWIQTDVSTGVLFHPTLAPRNTEWRNFGTNQMLAADPTTGEIRRFLTGPIGCEVTGVITTPDGRTMFVNIQHPGEPIGVDQDDNTADNPTRFSSWPDRSGRPRSATVVITKDDGGVIGS
jgi:uncharacterized protein